MSGERLTAPFWALFVNEIRKMWARKFWTALVAVAVLVVAGSLIARQAMVSQGEGSRTAAVFLQQNIANLRHELNTGHPSAATRRRLEAEISSAEQSLALQLQGLGPTVVSPRDQLRQTEAALRNTPFRASVAQVDQEKITLATDRYDIAHGVTNIQAPLDSGWQLPGGLLSGQGMILFALIVVMLVGDAVTVERHGRTLPLIFLHAANRRTAFVAKACAAIVAAWVTTLAICIGLFVLGGILMGFGSAATPYAVGERFGLVAGQIALASPHATILSQASYDTLALLLAFAALAAWAVFMTALSALSSNPAATMFLGVVAVLSPDVLQIAHVSVLSVLDPAEHLSLMADWLGATAAQLTLPWATLGLGAIVWVGWLAIALGYGRWRFARLEP